MKEQDSQSSVPAVHPGDRGALLGVLGFAIACEIVWIALRNSPDAGIREVSTGAGWFGLMFLIMPILSAESFFFQKDCYQIDKQGIAYFKRDQWVWTRPWYEIKEIRIFPSRGMISRFKILLKDGSESEMFRATTLGPIQKAVVDNVGGQVPFYRLNRDRPRREFWTYCVVGGLLLGGAMICLLGAVYFLNLRAIHSGGILVGAFLLISAVASANLLDAWYCHERIKQPEWIEDYGGRTRLSDRLWHKNTADGIFIRKPTFDDPFTPTHPKKSMIGFIILSLVTGLTLYALITLVPYEGDARNIPLLMSVGFGVGILLIGVAINTFGRREATEIAATAFCKIIFRNGELLVQRGEEILTPTKTSWSKNDSNSILKVVIGSETLRFPARSMLEEISGDGASQRDSA